MCCGPYVWCCHYFVSKFVVCPCVRCVVCLCVIVWCLLSCLSLDLRQQRSRYGYLRWTCLFLWYLCFCLVFSSDCVLLVLQFVMFVVCCFVRRWTGRPCSSRGHDGVITVSLIQFRYPLPQSCWVRKHLTPFYCILIPPRYAGVKTFPERLGRKGSS